MEIEKETRKYRIVIVDDDPLVMRGLMGFIEDESEFFVCGLFDSVEGGLLEIEELAPDLIITELSSTGLDGITLIEGLLLVNPDLSFLVVSRGDEILPVRRAIQTGARGYVLKSEAFNELVGAVRAVLGGGIYLSSTICERAQNTFLQDLPADASWQEEFFSGEELEVFQMMKTGLTTLEIADALVKPVNKVESHHDCIKRKLNYEAKPAIRWKGIV